MVRRVITFTLVLLCIWMPAHLFAGDYTKGILWQITKSHAEPSYVFGTIHLDDPAITTLPSAVENAFSASRVVITEVVFDEQSLMAMSAAMFYADGRTLSEVIGTELFEQVSPLLLEKGIPEVIAATIKPWAAAVTLSLPIPEGLPLDMKLQQDALQQSKEIDGLETVQEQIEALDGFSDEDEIQFLRQTIESYDEIPQMLDAMKRAYLGRDLGRLLELSDESITGADQTFIERFYERTIYQRNHRMVTRMRENLEAGRAFIAIGALHLPGKQGVLQLLENKGYQVSVVY